ncbi:hypothetical protein EVAR_65059_1 [Eumeta japonica]|uniref:Uncharacterized protein n=1 Tax=Eumeta variegata TaxID=151549 RepID=A0A4C1ZW96_EUMVA|nr:hypothetical protein EVAR_65059_1 [Eumeta japonica]
MTLGNEGSVLYALDADASGWLNDRCHRCPDKIKGRGLDALSATLEPLSKTQSGETGIDTQIMFDIVVESDSAVENREKARPMCAHTQECTQNTRAPSSVDAEGHSIISDGASNVLRFINMTKQWPFAADSCFAFKRIYTEPVRGRISMRRSPCAETCNVSTTS